MKKSLIVSAVLVTAVLFLMIFGFDAPAANAPADQTPILLLVENDTGAFLMQFRQGAQLAAEEQDRELKTEVVTAATLGNGALSGGSQIFGGALLLIGDDGLRARALSLLDELAIPSVVVSQTAAAHVTVSADPKQAGILAGSFAAGYDTVFLWGGGPEQCAGALGELGEATVLISNPIDPEAVNACVVALDEESALSLGKEKAAGAWDHSFVCWDPGAEFRAAWLESGIAQAMVLPAPYAMGYEAAAAALWAKPVTAFGVENRLVTPENMYDAQCVKQVFPLLH